MGSPLTPVLANIFMGFYKFNWLNEYNLSKPKFYLRYVEIKYNFKYTSEFQKNTLFRKSTSNILQSLHINT